MDSLRRLRRAPRPIVLLLAVTLIVATAGVAVATSPQAIHITTPKSASQITNIDILRQEIKNYYGDPTGTGVVGVDSYYWQEAESIANAGTTWLSARAKAKAPSGMKAIVMDVDDTTLTTWNYELSVNWAYTFASNSVYVNGQLFEAVPGMVEMANRAATHGYAIFYITGRGQAQEAATLGNLTVDGVGVDAGYPVPTTLSLPGGGTLDGLFTKPSVGSYPDYLNKPEFCGSAITAGVSCATIGYKSGTRAYIESLGYEIVANFGDQYSDLEGGYADKAFKMPNPNYYLP
jgi:HAD superfamily, subfamily IIIB (Acid phosphatase)